MLPFNYKISTLIYSMLLLFFVSMPYISKASVHLEPYAGIGLAHSSLTPSSQISTTYDFGARLGYKLLNLTTGVDMFFNFYRSSNSSFAFPSIVLNSPQTTTGFKQAGESLSILYSETGDESIQPFSIGVFGIFNIPLLFDAYGTAFYSFASSKYHGPGLKAGISYISSFFLNINLELQWTHFFCRKADCRSSSINTLALLLSLSIPLSFDLFDRKPQSHVQDNEQFGTIEQNSDFEDSSSE